VLARDVQKRLVDVYVVQRSHCHTCCLVFCNWLVLCITSTCSQTHSASFASHPQSWWGVSAWHIETSRFSALFDLLCDVDHIGGILTLCVRLNERNVLKIVQHPLQRAVARYLSRWKRFGVAASAPLHFRPSAAFSDCKIDCVILTNTKWRATILLDFVQYLPSMLL
jgi:hypothetical protein